MASLRIIAELSDNHHFIAEVICSCGAHFDVEIPNTDGYEPETWLNMISLKEYGFPLAKCPSCGTVEVF